MPLVRSSHSLVGPKCQDKFGYHMNSVFTTIGMDLLPEDCFLDDSHPFYTGQWAQERGVEVILIPFLLDLLCCDVILSFDRLLGYYYCSAPLSIFSTAQYWRHFKGFCLPSWMDKASFQTCRWFWFFFLCWLCCFLSSSFICLSGLASLCTWLVCNMSPYWRQKHFWLRLEVVLLSVVLIGFVLLFFFIIH